MKKYIKLFLCIMLFVPFLVYGKTFNYEETISKANNYIINYDEYRDYIMTEKMKYDFEIVDGVGTIKDNKSFYMGGLLSRDEYIITNIRNNSYLVSGLEYWTLTPYSNRRNYVLGHKLISKSYEETSNLRVSEYVRNEVKIGGSGTKDNPWYFLDVFSINLFSSDENRGKLSLNDCSNISDGFKTIYVHKYGDQVAPFYICEHKDFRYYDSTCRNYFDREVGSNKFEISGNIKDNTICRIDFAYKTYEITLDKCSGCSSPSPSVFYLAVNHDNYFNDEFGKTILNKIKVTPTKKGYTFMGYYRNNDYNNVNKVIDSSGSFVTKDLNSDSLLSPFMIPNTYSVSFDSNGGSGDSIDSINCTYDSYCQLPANTFSKSNYVFMGWTKTKETTQSNTGTSFENVYAKDNEKIMNLTEENGKNVKLYAKWLGCSSGELKYDSSKGGYICVKNCSTETTSVKCGSYVCGSESYNCSKECVRHYRGYCAVGGWVTTCSTRDVYCTSYCDKTSYYCPSGWSAYSGSDSNLKCYKKAGI